MKKFILSFVLLLVGMITIGAAVLSFADDGDIVKKYIKVKLKGVEKPVEVLVDSIDSIYFENDTIVLPKLQKVEFSKDSISIEVGMSESLTYQVFEAGYNQKCEIKVSDESVVSYDESTHIVKGLSEGSASIVAIADDGEHTDTCFVTVDKPSVDPTKVQSISLNTHSVELNKGETLDLKCTILPETADQTYTVSLSNPNVCGYSRGKITALAGGWSWVVVHATDGIHTDTCKVTVKEVKIPVESLTLSRTDLKLEVGQTADVTATIKPANATVQTVEWLVGDTKIATVNKGQIKAISAGETSVTASCDGVTASCKITVSAPVYKVTGVSLNKSSLTLNEKATAQLSATVSPSNATNKAVIWSSSEESVATVSSSGLVTAISEGQSTITVTTVDGSKTATCVVKVEAPVLTPEAIDLGLSVKWASCNYGATTKNVFGTELPWGCVDASASVPSVDNIIKTNYDVAHVKWGSDWRLPTEEEVTELIRGCEWETFTGNDGVAYYRGTSNENKATIEIPVGESDTFYWTGVKSGNGPSTLLAPSIQTESNGLNLSQVRASLACFIRPVSGYYKIPLTVELYDKTVSSTSATISIMFGGDKDDIVDYGIEYSESSTFSQSTKVAGNSSSLSANLVSISLTSLSKGTTYYYRAYVNIKDANPIVTGSSSFTTKNDIADMVDLHLPSKIKWASWNLGNTDPYYSSKEKYYLWGDPTGEKSALSYDGPTFDISGTSYDIATQMWGKDWRTPTKKEFDELLENCICEVKEVKGVVGMMVKAKPPYDTYIFLPCAGNKQNTGASFAVGKVGFYWTADVNPQNITGEAAYFTIQSESKTAYTTKHTYMSIRPVSGINQSQGGEGTDYEKSSDGVNLGIGSIRWAKWNVGAKAEDEYGDYIAFGELNGKDGPYSEYTYEFYPNGAYTNNVDIQGTEYDPARKRWGGKWRMPKDSEMRELINECNWEWTVINGTYGYKVSGKGNYSNNYIFLPAAGYKNSNGVQFEGTKGYYNSGTIYAKGERAYQWNYYLEFTNGANSVSPMYRYHGRSVRPVYDVLE